MKQEIQEAFNALVGKVDETLAPMREIEVKDQMTATQATACIRTCKDILKKVETRRKELKKPLIDTGREIDNQAAEWSKPFKEVEKLLLGRVRNFEAEQVRLRKEAERKRQEELEAKQKAEAEERAKLDPFDDFLAEPRATPKVEVLPAIETPPPPKVIPTRKDIQVTENDLKLVPWEFLRVSLDLQSVKKYYREHKKQIPGLSIKEIQIESGRL